MTLQKKQTPYEFLARWADDGSFRGAHVVFRESIVQDGAEIGSSIGQALPVSMAGEAGFPIAEILDALRVSAITDSEAKAAEIAALVTARAEADAARDKAIEARDAAEATATELRAQLAAMMETTDANGVPLSVTMVQAQLALLGAGLLDKVSEAIAAIPGDEGRAARITWDKAVTVERNHPLIKAMQGALGMSDADIDALFVAAGKL